MGRCARKRSEVCTNFLLFGLCTLLQFPIKPELVLFIRNEGGRTPTPFHGRGASETESYTR